LKLLFYIRANRFQKKSVLIPPGDNLIENEQEADPYNTDNTGPINKPSKYTT